MKEYDKILNEAYLQIKNGNIKPIEDILKLAREEYPPAEFLLGELNELNFGNTTEAAKWYKIAANHGHAMAQQKYTDLLEKTESAGWKY